MNQVHFYVKNEQDKSTRSCLTNGISQSDLCAPLMKSFATEDTEITEMKERVEDSQTEQIIAAA
ncbi:MAG: hypothetical protein ACYS22_13600, partial [Planctomycetota bacterium]